ncbi:MAG: Octanoyltransferase [Gammaproteobacteria bacterium]|nr:Octanoyltransferase [Gammaproteobacteria bacterium]
MTPTQSGHHPVVRHLGLTDYETAWREMQYFVEHRRDDTPDEIWLLQHPPVYTLGLNCRMSPRHKRRGIPVVQADRGGQITYHGPGQVIAYVMIDVRRGKIGVKGLVTLLEQAVIDLLAEYNIAGRRKSKAPGVYVSEDKIAALGVRIRRGCSYHGLSLNVDMDLSPFGYIDPCGYEGLCVTQLSNFGIQDTAKTIEDRLSNRLLELFNDSLSPTTKVISQ